MCLLPLLLCTCQSGGNSDIFPGGGASKFQVMPRQLGRLTLWSSLPPTLSLSLCHKNGSSVFCDPLNTCRVIGPTRVSAEDESTAWPRVNQLHLASAAMAVFSRKRKREVGRRTTAKQISTPDGRTDADGGGRTEGGTRFQCPFKRGFLAYRLLHAGTQSSSRRRQAKSFWHQKCAALTWKILECMWGQNRAGKVPVVAVLSAAAAVRTRTHLSPDGARAATALRRRRRSLGGVRVQSFR